VEQGCYAVHPSDTASGAHCFLRAAITTSKDTIKTGDFVQVSAAKKTVLDYEIVTRIRMPTHGRQERFLQVCLEKSH
jgi:hypothetical protein